MKKITITKIVVGILGAFILPSITFAAYNDVTLTTSAVFSVGGYTLNVSGSSATIASTTVNASNLLVTLASGSSITISSPTLNQITSDISSDITSNICTGSASSMTLAYSGGGTVTNTITPSATICTTSSGGGGGGAPVISLGGGGGGGGGGYVPPVITSTTTANVAGCPANTICTLIPSAVGSSSNFIRDLQVGSSGADVKSLQIFLNTHGYVIATSGAGSPGQETTTFGQLTKAAVMKFQAAHGISQVGNVGPITRAMLNSLLKSTTIISTPITVTSTASFTRNLSVGSEGSDVTKLQNILKAAGFLTVTPTGYFGMQTQAAVKAYQTAHGISATGTVGPLTRAELNK